MFNMGSITPNEIRDLEDFDLISEPAADQTFMQLGFSTLNAAASQAEASSSDLLAMNEVPDSSYEDVQEAGGFSVGQRVYWDGGDGVIEHLMVDGVLGVEGSPFAITATMDEPAASVRVYQDDQPTEFTVGKRVSELSATPIDSTTDPLTATSSGADLAATALNGAQVTALLEILNQIAAGTIDKDAAVALITAAFPTITEALASQMVNGTNDITPGDQNGGT
jgi:hypothetical protein